MESWPVRQRGRCLLRPDYSAVHTLLTHCGLFSSHLIFSRRKGEGNTVTWLLARILSTKMSPFNRHLGNQSEIDKRMIMDITTFSSRARIPRLGKSAMDDDQRRRSRVVGAGRAWSEHHALPGSIPARLSQKHETAREQIQVQGSGFDQNSGGRVKGPKAAGSSRTSRRRVAHGYLYSGCLRVRSTHRVSMEGWPRAPDPRVVK